MEQRWFVNRTNPEFVGYLARAGGFSPVLAQILISRGIKTVSDARTFLDPGLPALSDPHSIHGMTAAVSRIREALKHGERVLVHGDYDADGLTATAIMTGALRSAGIDTHYFIPNRMRDGYGFHPSSIVFAQRIGAGLLITVDCGITSFDAVSAARKAGIDVIITDHHEPAPACEPAPDAVQVGEFLVPAAVSVINPKLNPDIQATAQLSGAGVAFTVARALGLDEDIPFSHDDTHAFLDLAALGTLADVVPVLGENRILLREGLRRIHSGARPGVRALLDISGIGGREFRAGILSFTVVPRINAAGRISDASDVVRLLLADPGGEAAEIAGTLDRTNAERQRIEEAVYREAFAEAEKASGDTALILHKEGWHIGVIGIVASRLADELRRPAFVFNVESGIAKGSVRSIPGFDVHEALSRCRDLLISFGGHKQAAGVRLPAAHLPAFRERMQQLSAAFFRQEAAVPALELDADVAISEVSAGLVRELALLEPIGYGNPAPLLGARGLEVSQPRIVGSNHIRMRLRQRSATIEAIGFDLGRLFEDLATAELDAAFTPEINEWNGGRHLRLNLKAIRACR